MQVHPESSRPPRTSTDEVESIKRGDLPGHWRREIRSRATFLARNASSPTRDLVDELESAGLLALWRAARLFEPSRGTPFAHYARRSIHYAMVEPLEALNDPRYEGSSRLDDPKVLDQLVAPAENRPDNQYEVAETRAAVGAWIATCPPRLVLIFELMYEAGLTQVEVAELMGISQPRVWQYHQRLLSLGREALADVRAA